MAEPERQEVKDPRTKDPLQLETQTHDGHQTTVIRDPQGHIVYPSYVPPDISSPTDGQSPKPADDPATGGPGAGTLGPQAPTDMTTGPTTTRPRKSASDPIQLDSMVQEEGPQQKRPSIAAKAKTELLQKGGQQGGQRRHTGFPRMKRTGTNVSQLQQELWTSQLNRDDDSSSSSSSSEEEDEPLARADDDDRYGRFHVANEHYKTKGKVSKRDGRLAISVKDMSNTGYLAKALGAAAKKIVPRKDPHAKDRPSGEAETEFPRLSDESTVVEEDVKVPPLNIVIMVIGSRGDVQPFLKLGKVLKEQHGHRVRIATHPVFKDFVEKDSGVEFFSVGGDPSELMAFMVKNPGMIPTLETVKAGDIQRRRAAMAEMFEGFWRSCTAATDDPHDRVNLKMMGNKEPFVADAIIANPPSFAHIHCAEALGIPLHLVFTFPVTPTQAFPHPLASVKKSNVDPGYTNFISYPLVEMMVWQGLGDLVNDLRVKCLGLDPVSTLWAPGATYRLHVPFTYLWSPGLVPKPEDWGAEIDISGFVFLDLASSFKPPSDLERFLDAGEPPIYIGFGSIVVDDADNFTEMIFEAVKQAGVRALVSKGWGGLGRDDIPDNIFMLENTPHDWLFPRVKAAVIHGGAGTTAIALKCGLPTMVVPFFGDQHFWGSMLERCGAGPPAIPYKSLSAEGLADGIKYCLTDEAKEAAKKIAKDIEREGDGAENACRSFHQHLILKGEKSMRCALLPDKVAAWRVKETDLKLSPAAAECLVDRGVYNWRKLRLVRHCEWNDFEGPGEPVTGLAGSIAGAVKDVVGGVGGVPYRLAKRKQQRKERKEKRMKERAERRQKRREAAAQAKKERQEQRGADEAAGKKDEKAEEKSPEQQADSGKNLTPAPPSKHKESMDFAREDLKTPAAVATKDPMDGSSTQANNNTSTPNSKDNDNADNADTVSLAGTATTTATTATTASVDPAEEIVGQVTEGVGKSASALARAPVDLAMAVAQGFHNAPRLYGDDTVRRPPRVTGVRSGVRAAGSEFGHGVYDGFTGLVRLPVRGAKEGGGMGFVKGVGMGFTGLVLKNLAALTSGSYALKGVAKEVEWRGKQPMVLVRKARIIQGRREVKKLDEQPDSQEQVRDVREEVLQGFDAMRELWEAIERAERERTGGGAAGVLRRKVVVGSHRLGGRKLGVGAAFENVQAAKDAVEALKQGATVDEVLKWHHDKDHDDLDSPEKRALGRKSGNYERRSGEKKAKNSEDLKGPKEPKELKKNNMLSAAGRPSVEVKHDSGVADIEKRPSVVRAESEPRPEPPARAITAA